MLTWLSLAVPDNPGSFRWFDLDLASVVGSKVFAVFISSGNFTEEIHCRRLNEVLNRFIWNQLFMGFLNDADNEVIKKLRKG